MRAFTAKLFFKPAGLALGMAAGTLATLVVRQAWRLLSDQQELPAADSPENAWPDVLAAAALQGAAFAMAKSTARRVQALAMRRATSGPIP